MRKYLVLVALMSLALVIFGCGTKPEVEPETQTNTGNTQDGNRPGEGGTDEREQPIKANDLVTIYFDFDKYNLRDDARSGLRNNYEVLNSDPSLRITIEGHCDERGTVEYNLALGEKRARAAMDYLASLGISKDRITTISYGKERPVALGSNEDAWAQNRRAEFVRR